MSWLLICVLLFGAGMLVIWQRGHACPACGHWFSHPHDNAQMLRNFRIRTCDACGHLFEFGD